MLHPHLETKRIRFIPMRGSEDGEELYHLLTRLGIMSLPHLDAFLEGYGQGSEHIFVVESVRTGQNLGYATLQQLNPAGHVQGGVFLDLDEASVGMGIDVSTLLVNYSFASWDHLRKIYFLTTDASTGRFGGGLAGANLEGTMRDHLYFQGRHWDLYYYSLAREEWIGSGAGFLERLLPVAGP